MNKNKMRKCAVLLCTFLSISRNVYGGTYGVIKSNIDKTTQTNQVVGNYVHILGKQDDQYKIAVDNNIEYIEKESVEITSVLGIISDQNARLRTTPEPSAYVETNLKKGTLVSAHYRRGNWYYVKSPTSEGFVYKSQIEGENLSLLEERRVEQEKVVNNKASVEKLDWWKSARYVFPRGATALVEDVYTGKTFYIKRTFGTNHADVEALTAKDTATIRSIWGGFSWERRPVIVNIDNRRIAASLAAMPHAGKDSAPALAITNNLSGGYGRGQNLDVVKGNNMDGVMDLHFFNSMSHNDGKIKARVNPAHQRAVEIAAKAK